MVAELTENFAGWERIKIALDEIRACHEETLSFFTGVFDQLDVLCGSLLSREQWQKQAAARREGALASDTTEDSSRDLLLKEFGEDQAELHNTQQVVQEQIAQLTSMTDDLAATRNEFQSVHGELVRHSQELEAVRTQTLAASQEVEVSIKNKIHDMEQGQSWLEKEREVMEAELELVRSRAAEMAELLAERKQSDDPRQNQWVEELGQMRTLLESLTALIVESKKQPDAVSPVKPPTGVAAVAMNDPILESVLAQFEILRQDRVLRRAETLECAKNNNE